MKKLYLAGLALLATTAPAFAMPTAIGNLVISAALAIGAGAILPAASAAAIGVVKIVRRTKK